MPTSGEAQRFGRREIDHRICRLLRARHERPRRRRAAEKRDELPPSHVPPVHSQP